MREINMIVVHCSATPPNMNIGAAKIKEWHTNINKWSDIGYHYVITRDGTIEEGRPVDRPGAHARGFNADSIGVCLVGGVDVNGEADCNFTRAQWVALGSCLDTLANSYGPAKIVGHRDLSPDKDGDGIIDANERLKACPSFDVAAWIGG